MAILQDKKLLSKKCNNKTLPKSSLWEDWKLSQINQLNTQNIHVDGLVPWGALLQQHKAFLNLLLTRVNLCYPLQLTHRCLTAPSPETPTDWAYPWATFQPDSRLVFVCTNQEYQQCWPCVCLGQCEESDSLCPCLSVCHTMQGQLECVCQQGSNAGTSKKYNLPSHIWDMLMGR